MEQQNLEPNSSNYNNIEDQTRKQEELRLWCKALKITAEQFFSMPDEELKLRINNLKGRLRLKVAKNQIAHQKEVLDNIHYVSIENERTRNVPKSRQRGGANVWDILCQVAAEECDCQESGGNNEVIYEDEPFDETYDIPPRNITPVTENSLDCDYSYRDSACDSRFYDSPTDNEAESYDCDSIQINESFQPTPALCSTRQPGARGRQQQFRNYTDYDFELSGINSETEDENVQNVDPGATPCATPCSTPSGTPCTSPSGSDQYNARNNPVICPPGCEPSNRASTVPRNRQNANQTHCVTPRNTPFNGSASRPNSQNVNQTRDVSHTCELNSSQNRASNRNANETCNVQPNCRSGNATFNASRNSRCQNPNQTFEIPGNAYNASQNRRNGNNGKQQIVCPPGCVPISHASQNQVSNQNANQSFGGTCRNDQGNTSFTAANNYRNSLGPTYEQSLQNQACGENANQTFNVPPRNDPGNSTFNAAQNYRNSLGCAYDQSPGKNLRPRTNSTAYREENCSDWNNFNPQPTSTPGRTGCPACPPCPPCPSNNRSLAPNGAGIQNNAPRRIQGRTQPKSNKENRNLKCAPRR